MFSDLKQELRKQPFSSIFGQEEAKRQLKSALFMDRHVILSGPPGCGKTTLARDVAGMLPDVEANDCVCRCMTGDCPECRQQTRGKITISGKDRFIRVQGSPDLTAEDLIGDIDPVKAMQFGPLDIRSFTPGKIFKADGKILFFDELNRCSEKLQNALLQVLEEGSATISSYDVEIPSNFIFIGTMNPDDSSTEPLSDVFLDRFDIIQMGYPENIPIEKDIARSKGKTIAEFSDKLLTLTIKFIQELRHNKELEKVPSVRASIGIYERAQANAVLDGRTRVKFEDIEYALDSVLAHRLRLKASSKFMLTPKELIQKELQRFKSENDTEKGDVP